MGSICETNFKAQLVVGLTRTNPKDYRIQTASCYPFQNFAVALKTRSSLLLKRKHTQSLQFQVKMIIRSLFRRYERWNPVHPTYGAFWGIGVGIGCGVGWGPGFGPEVIGYVGSGCGVGFSIGITLLGLGIGLPANYLLEVPHNAFMVTRRGALDVARAGGLLGKGGRAGDVWGSISSHISEILQNPYASFSSFKMENWTENIMGLPRVKSTLFSNVKQITDGFQRGKRRFGSWDRGSKT